MSHNFPLPASGLTYWRLNENELYHPLPDSFDSGAYLLLQEASMSLVSKNTCDTSDWGMSGSTVISIRDPMKWEIQFTSFNPACMC